MYTNKIVYILIMLISYNIGIMAQTKISGKILDEKNEVLEGASIIVLNHSDSSYVSGTVTDLDGIYMIANIKSGSYLLSFSMIGYKKVNLSQQIDKNADIKLDDIVLEEDSHMLSAVTITGKRPPFKVEPGKTTVNLSSALLSTNGNILDVLKKLPGVIVQNDGTIVLNGKSGANVLIDDKVTYLSGESLINYLRSIPASSINNVELISQLSSKYDAAGNSGIINIQKKKSVEQGVNFTVSSGVERGKHTRWHENLSLAIRLNRLNIYADYSTYFGKDFAHLISTGSHLDPNTSMPTGLKRYIDLYRSVQYRGHYLKGGIDYELSDRFTVGSYITSYWNNWEKDEMSISNFFNGNKVQSDSTLTANNIQNVHYKNITGGVNILYKWTEKGKWDTSFDYQNFKQDDEQILRSDFQAVQNKMKKDTLSGNSIGDIKIYSVQTNLSYDFDDKTKVSGGLKSVFVDINNDAVYKNLIAGNWIEDENLSSGFGYQENINAAYVQLNSKWSSRFSTEIGLRLENTSVKNNYVSSKQDSVFNQNYMHIFPTVMGQYQLSENQSFSLTYGRRIVRPNYRDMNPFVDVKDQFLYVKGNTKLQPELIDNVEFSWLLKKQYAFSLFYSYRKNPIAQSYFVEDGNRVLVMPLNLAGNHSAGLRVGLNNMKPFKWWTIHINASLIYKQFDWMVSGESYMNEVVTPMIHISNQFSFPYGWAMELSGYYNGKMAEGQAVTESVWTTSFGVRKNIFNDKFGLYIYANDIFRTNIQRINLQSNFLDLNLRDRIDTRKVGITLSYRFNWGKETKITRSERSLDESKRINL